jgi:hypothetical protein
MAQRQGTTMPTLQDPSSDVPVPTVYWDCIIASLSSWSRCLTSGGAIPQPHVAITAGHRLRCACLVSAPCCLDYVCMYDDLLNVRTDIGNSKAWGPDKTSAKQSNVSML